MIHWNDNLGSPKTTFEQNGQALEVTSRVEGIGHLKKLVFFVGQPVLVTDTFVRSSLGAILLGQTVPLYLS